MSNQPIDKNYISPIDHFLYEFDKQHLPSEAQQKEIQKHALIAARRDHQEEPAVKKIPMEHF